MGAGWFDPVVAWVQNFDGLKVFALTLCADPFIWQGKGGKIALLCNAIPKVAQAFDEIFVHTNLIFMRLIALLGCNIKEAA